MSTFGQWWCLEGIGRPYELQRVWSQCKCLEIVCWISQIDYPPSVMRTWVYQNTHLHYHTINNLLAILIVLFDLIWKIITLKCFALDRSNLRLIICIQSHCKIDFIETENKFQSINLIVCSCTYHFSSCFDVKLAFLLVTRSASTPAKPVIGIRQIEAKIIIHGE